MSLSSPIRFGLVGYGAWGQFHARSIEQAQNAELVAIAVPSEESRHAAKNDFPDAAIFESHEALIQDAEIDIIDIVTPTANHYEVARAALEADKHLLLEKPMAPKLEECVELEELARSRGKSIAVGHELRLSSQWGEIKSIIEQGVIGHPQYALVELSRRPYRPGSNGWRFDRKRVGSWILEEPIHFFDLARWYLSSLGEPERVYAAANSRDPSRSDLHDNFSCLMNFKGGAYAVISQTLAAFEHHQTVKISGTKGAVWAGWSGSKDRTEHPTHFLKVFDGAEVDERELAQSSGEVFELRKQIEHVAQCLIDEKAPHANGVDGIWSVGMCLAAEESFSQGQPVDVAEFMGRHMAALKHPPVFT